MFCPRGRRLRCNDMFLSGHLCKYERCVLRSRYGRSNWRIGCGYGMFCPHRRCVRHNDVLLPGQLCDQHEVGWTSKTNLIDNATDNYCQASICMEADSRALSLLFRFFCSFAARLKKVLAHVSRCSLVRELSPGLDTIRTYRTSIVLYF